MKKNIIVLAFILLILFFLFDNETQNRTSHAELYPWQVSILPSGRSRVFGIILEETLLKEVDVILNKMPKVAVFESKEKLSLEAFYENISLGGLIGSFMFTLEAKDISLDKLKKKSRHVERVRSDGVRYALDRSTSDKLKTLVVKNLIYIPTAQLDEKTILKYFGQPAYKIKLKTKEIGWHYLYPEKGLDLIYKEEGKEVLQYVEPKTFNVLLAPLQSL